MFDEVDSRSTALNVLQNGDLNHSFLFSVSYATNLIGSGYIQYNVTGPEYQVRMREDELRIRFRTNDPFGLMFHADSSQGDFLTVELVRGILRTSIALGEFY